MGGEVMYSRTGHTDGRVRDRIVWMGLAWLKKMGEDLTVIFPTKAEQKAADRLLSKPRISTEHILAPHCEAIADRCPGGGGDLHHSGYDGAEPRGPGGHGRPGRARWRRQGQQRHPGPCRAGA